MNFVSISFLPVLPSKLLAAFWQIFFFKRVGRKTQNVYKGHLSQTMIWNRSSVGIAYLWFTDLIHFELALTVLFLLKRYNGDLTIASKPFTCSFHKNCKKDQMPSIHSDFSSVVVLLNCFLFRILSRRRVCATWPCMAASRQKINCMFRRLKKIFFVHKKVVSDQWSN